jgi:PBSX family phage terminase large subunit
MEIKTGTIYNKTRQAFDDGFKICIHRGGTGSGKTYDNMLYLFSVAVTHPDLIITVVSESRPHLEIGAIRILSGICKPLNLWGKENWNISKSTWTSPTGTIIEFFSADRIDKALGARRDWLYGNEINSLKKDVWDELARRTENVIADFNPTAQFWVEDWAANYDKVLTIKSNYLDNPFLPETEKNRIAKRASRDENFRRIHIDCEYGVTEGIIFSNWMQVDRMPEGDKIYGLDFGFSCFSGETLITTSKGLIQIKDVKKGDLVLTRKGYRLVKRTIYNGYKKVIEKKLITDALSTNICATHEHHFYANGKWKKYGELTERDVLCVQSSLKEKSTTDTHQESMQTIILASIVERFFKGINTLSQNAVQMNTHINYQGLINVKNVRSFYCDVYDLEIEDAHEYFANGILVHNCDPTSLVATIETDEAYYVDELIYQTGMLNSHIINRLESLGIRKSYDEIIADSAEPKSIQEIHNAGFNIKPAVKGADSVRTGIDRLQSRPIYVTQRSTNLIKELRSYSWALDKDGNPTNKPIDMYNHGIDALRYSLNPKHKFSFAIR